MEKEKYFCNCLNVIINTNSKNPIKISGKQVIERISVEDESEIIDPFFDIELLDVNLDISGIEMYHAVLTKERSCDHWVVVTCLNCGMDTHAIHSFKGSNRVLLSRALPRGIEKLKEYRDSPLYSKFLKIKLLDPSETVRNKAAYLTPIKLVEAIEKIETTTKKLLQIEKEQTMERIRVFTEKEHQRLADLEAKAMKDKEITLRNLQHLETSDGLFDTFTESYFGLPATESRDVHTELPTIKVNPGSVIMLATKQKDIPMASHEQSHLVSMVKKDNLGIPKSGSLGQQVGSERKKHNSDADDILFDLEGYHNYKNCEPFYESDGESSGDANSLDSSGGFPPSMHSSKFHDHGGNAGDRVYATSLPVPVPIFNNVRLSYTPDSDDESKKSPSLAQIAASFKAVAKSMQDSTGMFGDLPPRRIFAETNMSFGQL